MSPPSSPAPSSRSSPQLRETQATLPHQGPGENPTRLRPKPTPQRRGALAGLVLVVVLILVGLLLSRLLGRAARLQDCVISGRTDCSSADSTSGRN